jgi:ATP-binding protein involved in chromosome partitioning
VELCVNQQILEIIEPYFQQSFADLGASVASNGISVSLTLPYPALSLQEEYQTLICEKLGKEIALELIVEIKASPQSKPLAGIEQVKNIIAVASGKGGVGKSTTSVNLALALAQEGANVGILDADIYGPSQGMMLGLPDGTRPDVTDVDGKQFMLPVEAHGVKAMSMAFLITDKTPVVWRGPMVSGALQQLLTQTKWGELDYLIIDLPPGTGDIQLTMAQKIPVSGSIVVTTPQDIALLDAKKGVEMFTKVNIPVLGVVENMATHICTNCGHEEHIFGQGGGESIAAQYNTEVLASLPLSLDIRMDTDAGKPSVAANSQSDASIIYRTLARKTALSLANLNKQTQAAPIITMAD